VENNNAEHSDILQVGDIDRKAIQMSEIRPSTLKCPKPNED
jgi:hypothetical protein